MNRTFVTLLVAATTLALFGGGCSVEQTGNARSEATTETSGPPSSASGAGASVLADVKPCDLLSPGEAAQLSLPTPGEARKTAGGQSCEWIDANGGVTANVLPARSVEDLDYAGAKATSIKIGKYESSKVEAPNGALDLCHVVISVADSASVQVVGGVKPSSTDTAAACERATKAAELIAPKLP
ncbi:DUF3558 family protein [Umezawaea sp.]|uniref:DUF3558 family protein n=1 Tax=Umezawaea sp. TaxID=1955258 RepID=UPI002ED0DA0C